MWQVADHLLKRQRPLPVLIVFFSHCFLEMACCDDVDAGVYFVEAGVGGYLEFEEVYADEGGVAEGDFYADAVFEEVHFGGRVAGFVEDGGLIVPAFTREEGFEDLVEMGAGEGGGVDGGVGEEVFYFLLDG